MAPIDAPFPSDRWFAELVARAEADTPAMERLGIADLRIGLEVVADDGSGSWLFGLVFDGYDVDAVVEPERSGFVPEVVVSGPLSAWEEMVHAIEANGRADAAHTLNTLTITGVPFSVRAADAMGQDKLYRYMGTVQAVLDAAGADPFVAAGR
jgi:hypothetical protein